ncbi:MAG TPA: DUF885 domain-containing protein, partial [Amphiplicatus sp.]|nr:DUF885 domain-containing protein [Amphiplicatus sp.]
SSRLMARDPKAELQRRERMEALLAGVKAIDASQLGDERRASRDSIVAVLEGGLAPARVVDYGAAFGEYGVWFLPYVINHNSGVLVAVPSLLDAQHTVKSAADADAYIARLKAYGLTIDGALQKMREDVTAGVTPPDFIIERTIEVIDGFVGPGPQGNLLYAGFEQKLADAGLEGADAYKAEALAAVKDEIFPAFGRVRAYLEEISPTATHDAGVWRLPNGDAFYRAMVRQMTDTDLTPDEIHQIGLDEVACIDAEMDAILRREGYTEGTVGERMVQLAKEDRFKYPNTAEGRAAILADIKGQLDGVNAVLPEWFGKLPKYGVEVRAVPAFSEATAAGGYYDAPALDGSRPGIYWINLRDTAVWPKFSVPTLTYHEAVPGHHMQTAVALDQGAPLIVNILFSNASGEGWGLYAERLAWEMGLYADDPFGDLGRLRDEMHRAIRLVVDTGMHAKHWSREQAIDYMHAHEGADLSDETSEIERYVAWPGQALGYKIGMLKILELRKAAQESL